MQFLTVGKFAVFRLRGLQAILVGVYSIGLLLIDVNYNQLFSVVFLYQRTLNVYVIKAYLAIQVPNSQT